MDIFDKAHAYNDPPLARAHNIYPYFSVIEETFGTEVKIDGKRVIMAGSNNYMGLSSDPRVKEAAIAATNKYGSTCSGSRLLNGTLSLHAELEEKFAAFLKRDAAAVFSTGYTANLGTLSSLLGKGDIVYMDKGDHGSIVDGVRLGAAEMKRFRHNTPEHLELLLREAAPDAGKMVVVDGVFSMEGDVAPLDKIAELKKTYNFRLMVDEAHGMGVFGKNGRGTAEHFGVEDDVDIVMGTFSKAFASLGGVIAGPAKVIEFIKHKARSMIFQASMTPGACGACLKSLEIVQAEPERREKLFANADHVRNGFKALGFDTLHSNTPVVPVIIGDDLKTFSFWRALLDAGVFTNPVISPAVAPGQQLIRTSFMATHTTEQLDRVIETFDVIGRKFGIIGADKGKQVGEVIQGRLAG